LLLTNGRCCLLWPSSRPLRPIVTKVPNWLIEEARADLRIIDQTDPNLKLLETPKKAGFGEVACPID
jgi:hypothetical protein